ncbi:FecR domain-containing protein [Xylophilus sp. ASV27]|uniref:FecR domain-containing protein n=1 Tax=Xylophilus sp. ASV27 TaxID=2795129 RepID=UPI0018EA6512|nr:FecR domain-containing protein [Xylophilus sp. ASV27]
MTHRPLPLMRGVAAAALALALQAAAQTASADVLHTVAPGDTLSSLAQRYLDDAQQWKALAQANGSPQPRRLPVGAVLRIPGDLLRAVGGSARVLHLSGTVTQIDPDGRERPLLPDEVVAQGQRVRTAHNGFVTLALADGSQLRVAGDSELLLDRLRPELVRRRAQTLLDLRSGRVELRVAPQVPAGSRFEVRTPLMAAGVRGTRFGVSVTAGGGASGDVEEGLVQMQARDDPQGRAPVVVQPGQGTAMAAGDRAPGAPSLLLPGPDLAGVPALHERPVLDIAFPAVPGAVAYRGYVARDAALERIEANALSTAPRLRFEDLDDGDYEVAVRAIDARGIEGAAAQHTVRLKARPLPPATLQPAQNQEIPGAAVLLQWAERPGATGYALQVARDAQFRQLVSDQPALATSEFTLPALPSGVYHWRVRTRTVGRDGQPDLGPYGDARSFSVRRPIAPAQLMPQAGEGLAVRWDGEPGQRFLLQVARDEAFSDIVLSRESEEPQAELPLAPGRYWVRFQATDADGFVRRFSSPQQVRIETALRSGDGGMPRTSDGGRILLD